MIRASFASGALLLASLEPVMSDTDLGRYAITQGGLLFVVLVLLWSYRRDNLGALKEREDQIRVMADMVSKSTEALTKSADASERMARAVENLEQRSANRRTDR